MGKSRDLGYTECLVHVTRCTQIATVFTECTQVMATGHQRSQNLESKVRVRTLIGRSENLLRVK